MESKHSKYIPTGLTAPCVLTVCITSPKDDVTEPLQTGVGYFLTPIQSGVNTAGTGIHSEIRGYGSLKDALVENEELRSQVAQFAEDNNHLQAGQLELSHLWQLYELDQERMQYEKIGVRVIARDSEKWFQVFRINESSKDGVATDMNVAADGGLVRAVTDAGANHATVRSITDDSSRMGAMRLNSSYTCIVAEDLTLCEEGKLKLTDFLKDAQLWDGDRIITSNISSRFLPGILIGYATDVTIDSEHLTRSGYLTPTADFDNLQGVLIVMDIKGTGEVAAQ